MKLIVGFATVKQNLINSGIDEYRIWVTPLINEDGGEENIEHGFEYGKHEEILKINMLSEPIVLEE